VRPFNTAADRNKDAILERLREVFADQRRVLEIGSGTGQHAVHFAGALPHLTWQPSDMADKIEGMTLWLEEAGLPNILPPLAFDVTTPVRTLPRPADPSAFDGVYTSNTLHIVPPATVEAFFARIGEVLAVGGRCAVYGPFKYGGRFTTPSNEAFHAQLRTWHPLNGIRDFEWVDGLARAQGLQIIADHAMPANNQLLVWERQSLPDG